jgi:hypothetical protein
MVRMFLVTVMMFLVLSASGQAHAGSCLSFFDPATAAIEDQPEEFVETCISQYGWDNDFFEVPSCEALNFAQDVGYMHVYCAAGLGGTYYANSANCEGQGVLDRHMTHGDDYGCTNMLAARSARSTMLKQSPMHKYRLIAKFRAMARKLKH